MTPSEQSRREVDHVLHLARHVQELCGSDPTAYRPDPPDVRVSQDLGIEVVGFHRQRGGRPLAAIERARELVTEMAQAAYEASNRSPISVHIHFNDGPLPQRELPLLAEQVAGAAALAAGLGRRHQISRGDLPEPAAGHILSIVARPCSLRRPWDCLSGGSVETSWAPVEELVRKKEAQLDRWPTWATRRWLLVVAGGADVVRGVPRLRFSAMYPQTDLMPPPRIASSFDRVYFLDVLTDHSVQLA